MRGALATVLCRVFCAECRPSVHVSVTVRAECHRKLCTECSFCAECFKNTRYNVKYAECFACAECKDNLS
jgi:hypothetical protein